MAAHVAQDVRLVAALTGAKVLWRFAALISQVTLEAVFPLVVTAAVATHPRLLQAFRVDNVAAGCKRFRGVGALLDLLRGSIFRRGPADLSVTAPAEALECLLGLAKVVYRLVLEHLVLDLHHLLVH